MLAQRVRQSGVCAVRLIPLPPTKDFLKSSQGSYAQSHVKGELSLQAVIALPAQSHTPPAHRHPCYRVFAPACQPAPAHSAARVPLLNWLSKVSLALSSKHSLFEALLLNLVPALHHPHVADQGNLNSAPQHWVLVTHLTALCNAPLVDSGMEGWSFCSFINHLLFCSSCF